MQSAYSAPPSSGPLGWLRRAEAWLDDRGKAAWIAAMVLGFVFVWPVGLASLAYMIWSKRMGCNWGRRGHHRHNHHVSWTGNTAFDTYREETLKRLEEERDAFVNFLDQLRAAKDKAEFDQFMAERRAGGTAAG